MMHKRSLLYPSTSVLNSQEGTQSNFHVFNVMNDMQFNIQESVASTNSNDELLIEQLLLKTQYTYGSNVSPLKDFKLS